jgi:3-carboxy-cis,cis-muconate cycloisomerase
MAERGLFGGVFARGDVDTGDQAWLTAMLDTEAALARALERAGLAPAGAGAAVTEAANVGTIDAADLGRRAALTGNPVPALVRALTRSVPAAAAAAVHRGATSQDIIDTAAMLLARRALAAIAADVTAAADAAAGLAAAHRDTVMIGRTLLQQAVPVTFGLVAAGWLISLDEARANLDRVRAGRLAVQFGGAAGTLSSLGADGPRVAALLAEELGLPLPVLPWHTDRLRIVEVGASCACAAAALGKIARDVTLLAQSEVAEVREGSGASETSGGSAASEMGGGEDARRGGSSAMPHKRNPVAAIAVLGCTRRVPGLLATLAAAAEQEHQRAAGAWHSEWEPVRGPAQAYRFRRVVGGGPTRRAARGPGADEGQPRLRARAPARRAGGRAARPGLRCRRCPRPDHAGQCPGGRRRDHVARGPAGRPRRAAAARPGRHHHHPDRRRA